MSQSDASELFNTDERDFGAGDFFCAEALVAKTDDPENRCRVQCVIPIFDEDEIHEVWARRVQIYVGDDGFGDYFIPELNTEVLVWGRMGDTNNLFYAPVWNEERKPSADFPNKNFAGVRVPKNLLFIAMLLAKIEAQNFDAIIEQTARILANNIESNAQQLNKVLGNQVRVEAQQNALVKGNQVQLQAANQMQINGATISVSANGSISISGGNISISGSSVTIEGRPVRKVGPAI